jgi:hypothetical protein
VAGKEYQPELKQENIDELDIMIFWSTFGNGT